MPAFIITESGGQLGQPIDAVLADLTTGGAPDRATDTPVKITLSDHTLTIDGEVGPPRLRTRRRNAHGIMRHEPLAARDRVHRHSAWGHVELGTCREECESNAMK